MDLDDLKNNKCRLIDFGLVSRYLDADGNHISNNVPSKFKGSMLFASPNAFRFVETSRRDDLISLIYVMLFLLDLSRLSFINDVDEVTKSQQFEIIKTFKVSAGSKELCGTQDKGSPAYFLTQFVDTVMSLDYSQTPPYEKLKE